MYDEIQTAVLSGVLVLVFHKIHFHSLVGGTMTTEM